MFLDAKLVPFSLGAGNPLFYGLSESLKAGLSFQIKHYCTD